MKVTRKEILLISLAGTVVYLSLAFFRDKLYDYCFSGGHCWRLWDSFDTIGSFVFLFPLVFLLSLITYKMREEVFRAWLHFAYWWIPLSIILTLITPDGSGSGGWGIPVLIDREFVALIFSTLFTIISLIVIAWKYFTLRSSKAV